MASGGSFPAPVGHRVLAIDLDARDPVVGRVSVGEGELPVQVDLNEGAHVGLLGLVELVIVPPSGVLPVVQLVERVAEHRRDLVADRVEPVQFRFHLVHLGVGIAGQDGKQRLVDHGRASLVLDGRLRSDTAPDAWDWYVRPATVRCYAPRTVAGPGKRAAWRTAR